MLRRLFSPLRHAARLFFFSQLRLRWRGGPRLEFGLRGDAHAPSTEQLAARQAERELAAMRQELAQALDEMPDLRDELRHLAYFEQALLQEGLQALHAVPLDVLQRALDQFEGLVTNWSPAGLASLRSKMAVAILQRETEPEDSVAPSAARRSGAAGATAGRAAARVTPGSAAAARPVSLHEV